MHIVSGLNRAAALIGRAERHLERLLLQLLWRHEVARRRDDIAREHFTRASITYFSSPEHRPVPRNSTRNG